MLLCENLMFKQIWVLLLLMFITACASDDDMLWEQQSPPPNVNVLDLIQHSQDTSAANWVGAVGIASWAPATYYISSGEDIAMGGFHLTNPSSLITDRDVKTKAIIFEINPTESASSSATTWSTCGDTMLGSRHTATIESHQYSPNRWESIDTHSYPFDDTGSGCSPGQTVRYIVVTLDTPYLTFEGLQTELRLVLPGDEVSYYDFISGRVIAYLAREEDQNGRFTIPTSWGSPGNQDASIGFRQIR